MWFNVITVECLTQKQKNLVNGDFNVREELNTRNEMEGDKEQQQTSGTAVPPNIRVKAAAKPEV
jgi:hypothetical protein